MPGNISFNAVKRKMRANSFIITNSHLKSKVPRPPDPPAIGKEMGHQPDNIIHSLGGIESLRPPVPKGLSSGSRQNSQGNSFKNGSFEEFCRELYLIPYKNKKNPYLQKEFEIRAIKENIERANHLLKELGGTYDIGSMFYSVSSSKMYFGTLEENRTAQAEDRAFYVDNLGRHIDELHRIKKERIAELDRLLELNCHKDCDGECMNLEHSGMSKTNKKKGNELTKFLKDDVSFWTILKIKILFFVSRLFSK